MRRFISLWALLAVLVPAKVHAQSGWAGDVLAAHNAFRAQVGVPPLEWDTRLAADAVAWAMQLGLASRLAHSAGSNRVGEGENLSIGTAGAFSAAEAIGRWGAERANYVRGTFPNVSRTGAFETVAHYTQIVWRDSRHVGCGMARAGGWDVLVCRYSAPGNVIGQVAY